MRTLLATVGLAALSAVSAAPAGAAPRATSAYLALTDRAGQSDVAQVGLAANGTVGLPATEVNTSPQEEITDARGTTLAVLKFKEGDPGSDAYTVNADTGRRKLLLRNASYAQLTGEAGQLVAISSRNEAKAGASRLVTIPVKGGSPRVVAKPPAGRDFSGLAVTDDGGTAYTCSFVPLTGGTQADFARLTRPTLLRVDLHTGRVTTVAAKLTQDDCIEITASPDGTRLAVSTGVAQGDSIEALLVTIATHKVQGLAPRASYSVSGWAPDGHSVFLVPGPATTTGLVRVHLPDGHRTAIGKVLGLTPYSLVRVRPTN